MTELQTLIGKSVTAITDSGDIVITLSAPEVPDPAIEEDAFTLAAPQCIGKTIEDIQMTSEGVQSLIITFTDLSTLTIID